MWSQGDRSNSSRAILFVDFRVRVEAGSAGLGNDYFGRCGGQIARGDELRNSLGGNGLVFMESWFLSINRNRFIPGIGRISYRM